MKKLPTFSGKVPTWILITVISLGAIGSCLLKDPANGSRKTYTADEMNNVGLHLGMSRQQVISLIGRPDESLPCQFIDPANCIEFKYAGLIREINEDTGRMEISDLKITFLSNRLIEILILR